MSDTEQMDAREYVNTEQCPWHITDTIECLILGFILAIVLKFLYTKWRVYRAKKVEEKMNGIRSIYKQALESRNVSPSAPISFNPVPKVTPYTGVASEIDKLN